VCGRELRRPTGVIQSPNYPGTYSSFASCEWAIILPARRQILLNVTDFYLESSQDCTNDYLEIRYIHSFIHSFLQDKPITKRTGQNNRYGLRQHLYSGVNPNLFFDGEGANDGGEKCADPHIISYRSP